MEMGVYVSKIVSYYSGDTEARSKYFDIHSSHSFWDFILILLTLLPSDLGNPKEALYSDSTMAPSLSGHHGINLVEGISTNFSIFNSAESGETVFVYQLDWTKFDRGHLIIVKYEHNWAPEDDGSLENEILRRGSVMPISYFHQHVFPSILPLDSYITTVRFATRKGVPSFKVVDWRDITEQPYNEMPPIPNMPIATISNLCKSLKFSTGRGDVDIVTYDGELFTFKHHGIFPNYALEYEDRFLEEATHVAHFSSPYILRPSHLVSGKSDGGPLPFRGILYPYLPAGSLADVLRRLQTAKPSDKTTLDLLPLWTSKSQDVPKLKISWPTKLRWCADMARGLVDIHAKKAYVGHLTPDNFFLDKSGDVKLGDITPVRGFNVHYSAPEVTGAHDDVNFTLTSARDVFSMGIVYWNLAEERLDSDRVWPDRIPYLSWTNTDRRNAAPPWFRVLVKDCMDMNPSRRPSAAEILDTFTIHLAASV